MASARAQAEYHPRPQAVNDYIGYIPPNTRHTPSIDRVSVEQLTPQLLWHHYIRQRKPVVIQGFPTDAEWNAEAWTDLSYLSSLAGHVPVKIEPIHPDLGHFGTAAKRQRVSFAEFTKRLRDPRKKKGDWYLTTQYDSDDQSSADDANTGHPAPDTANGKRKRGMKSSPKGDCADENDCENSYRSDSSSSSSITASSSSSAPVEIQLPIADQDISSLPAKFRPEPLDPLLPSPTHALADDFPLQPALMGNLVLQQTNLWLGNSQEGKSSGLHHDFHDNLYALLSGRKRFLLFPPVAHAYLQPRGVVERVHPNGLLQYTPRGHRHISHPMTRRLSLRSDGLPPSEAARWVLLARRQELRMACDRAAKGSGEGHVPGNKRKGKARMTSEMETALLAYETCVMQVTKMIRHEESVAEEEEEAAAAAAQVARLSQRVQLTWVRSEGSDYDDDEVEEDQDFGDFDSDDASFDSAEYTEEERRREEDGMRALVARGLITFGRTALQHDVTSSRDGRVRARSPNQAVEYCDFVRGDISPQPIHEVKLSALVSPQEFAEPQLAVQRHKQKCESDSNDSSSPADSMQEDRPGSADALVIPRRQGHGLPGGLRRDSDTEDFFEDEIYDDGVLPADILLMSAEGDVEDFTTANGNDPDIELDLEREEEMMSMVAQVRQTAERMVRAGGADQVRGEEMLRNIETQESSGAIQPSRESALNLDFRTRSSHREASTSESASSEVIGQQEPSSESNDVVLEPDSMDKQSVQVASVSQLEAGHHNAVDPGKEQHDDSDDDEPEGEFDDTEGESDGYEAQSVSSSPKMLPDDPSGMFDDSDRDASSDAYSWPDEDDAPDDVVVAALDGLARAEARHGPSKGSSFPGKRPFSGKSAQVLDGDEEDDDLSTSDWGEDGDAGEGEALLAALESQARAAGNPRRVAPSSLGKFGPAGGVYEDEEQYAQEHEEEEDTEDEEDNEDREPLSFSLISPWALHRHFRIPSSISSPLAEERKRSAAETHRNLGGQRGFREAQPHPRCPLPMVVDLLPGQMLYLPASWWHEVTSEGTPIAPQEDKRGEKSDKVETAADANVHMALNWWFHPPDNLVPPSKVSANGRSSSTAAQKSTFDEPYRDVLVWKMIRDKVNRRLERARRAAKCRKERGVGHEGKRRRKGA